MIPMMKNMMIQNMMLVSSLDKCKRLHSRATAQGMGSSKAFCTTLAVVIVEHH